jgi:hypothetical protein
MCSTPCLPTSWNRSFTADAEGHELSPCSPWLPSCER